MSTIARHSTILRLLFWLGLATAIAVAVVVGLQPVRSWDVFWHIKTGQMALTPGVSLDIDPFGLTQVASQWGHKDLGAQIVLWLLYDRFGPIGLSAYKLMASLGVLICCLAIAKRAARGSALGPMLAVWAYWITTFRLIARPASFSLVFVGLLMLLIATGFKKRWHLLVVAPFFVIWANLHRGVVLGLVLLWLLAVAQLVWSRVQQLGTKTPKASVSGSVSRPIWVYPVAAAVIASVASCLNPSGVQLILTAIAVSNNTQAAAAISEWEALGVAELWLHFPVATLWLIAMFLAALTVVFRWKHVAAVANPIWLLGCLGLMAFFGLKAPRWLAVMAIATLGPVSVVATASAAAFQSWRTSAANAKKAADAASDPRALSMLLASLLLVTACIWSPRVSDPSPGLAERWYPEAAVLFLEDQSLVGDGAGEGFTTFTFAGYVIQHLWPATRVPCDGRYDTVYSDEVMARCLAAPRDPALFAGWVDEFDLTWVLAHNRTGNHDFAFLATDPQWRLVFWDAAALVYVRDIPEHEALIEAREYRHLVPQAPIASLSQALSLAQRPEQRREVGAEVRRLAEQSGGDYRADVLLALYLSELGPEGVGELRRVLNRLRSYTDDDPIIAEVLDRLVGHAP